LREKTLQQEYLDFSRKSSVKVVREYRMKYKGISEVLELNPKILNLAHKDFSKGLSESDGGRRGYTSEQILRSLIVMFIEGDSFRDVVVRIENSRVFPEICKARCYADDGLQFFVQGLWSVDRENMEGNERGAK